MREIGITPFHREKRAFGMLPSLARARGRSKWPRSNSPHGLTHTFFQHFVYSAARVGLHLHSPPPTTVVLPSGRTLVLVHLVSCVLQLSLRSRCRTWRPACPVSPAVEPLQS